MSSRSLRAEPFVVRLYDAKRGMVSNISDQRLGLEPDYYKFVSNWLFDRPRLMSVRGGSRSLTNAGIFMGTAPRSLGKYRPTSGSTALMVGRGTGIALVTPGAFTAQAMPGAAVFAVKPLRFEQLNDVLWVAEHLGANKPFGYIGTGWVSVDLPLVAPSPSAAVGAAGNVDIGQHFYRVRHTFINGSSIATPVTGPGVGGSVVPGVASIINVGNPPGPNGLPTVAPGGRTDWLFWTLERTKANDPLGVNGTWYFVRTGTTATVADNVSDASLFDVVKDGWYTGPQIFNGIVPHADRMFGWTGSLLFPSWAIGQRPFLGIFNFDPLNAYRIGADDGDIILTVVRQAGRLVVFKARSHHFLEGRDLSSFTVTDFDGGVSGPRAACVVLDRLFYYNDAGLFELGKREPFGWREAGHYLSQINPGARDKVILRAIGTRYLFIGYPPNVSSVNLEALTYDFLTGTWSHHTEVEAADLLYQQDADFGSARSIMACPVDQGASQFQLFAGFDGVFDKRASDGTGGVPVRATADSPLLDLNVPDEWKEITRIEGSIESDGASVSVTISSPDTGESSTTNITSVGEGDNWAPAAGAGADDAVWDTTLWNGTGEERSTPSGVRRGLLCKRFRLTISSTPDSPVAFLGATVDGKLRPERRNV
jgi:hypothetical protein